MAGGKKSFPCGHSGKGRYCHRCAQEEERRREEEQRRQESVAAREDWSRRLLESPIPLDHVPRPVAERTLEIIKGLRNGTTYRDLKGKRLVTLGQRDVVSVPVGRRHRLIYRESAEGLEFIEMITHETYNNRLGSGGWGG